MQNYIIDGDIILSADNRKKYAISIGVCLAIILITFFMPIISFYGQSVSIFDIFGIAGTVDSLASITGTSQYIGNNYRMLIFIIFFLPVLVVGIVSFINLKRTSRFYATVTIVVSVVGAIYSYILSMVIAGTAETLSAFRMGPVVVQVIAYAFIAIFTYIFIREPISAQMKGKIYYGDPSAFENIRQSKKSNKRTQRRSSNSTENGRNINRSSKMSKFELENMKLKDMLFSIKRNIGEYIYSNKIVDSNTAILIEKVDDYYEKIGKNIVELLRSDNKKICSGCGNISPTESNFCSECGKRYLQDQKYSREKYIDFSKGFIDIRAKNQIMANIKQENQRILGEIQETFANIGDVIYKSQSNYGEKIAKDIEEIKSIEKKIKENRDAYLKEKGLIICSNCKSEIKKDSKFCDQCGVKVVSDEDKKDKKINIDKKTEKNIEIEKEEIEEIKEEVKEKTKEEVKKEVEEDSEE